MDEFRASTPPRGHRYIFYGIMVLCAVLLWNTFHGDPSIYLCQTGFLQFNPGELSGVFTSPLWAGLAYVFSTPLLFKLLGVGVAGATLYVVFDSQKTVEAEMIAGCTVFPFLTYTLMGAETALGILLTVTMYRGSKIAPWLLPLVRPEGIILTVFHSFTRKTNYWHILPFVAWTTVLYVLGDGQSAAETRITGGMQYYFVRYSAVFVAYGMMWVLDNVRLPVYVLLLVSFFPMKEVSWANAERNRGYNFDTIILREQAEYFNETADEGETILAREIQMRYYLRPDLRVQSVEGLVNTNGTPTLALQTNRDEGNNNAVLKKWDIRLSGFLEWASAVRLSNKGESLERASKVLDGRTQ